MPATPARIGFIMQDFRHAVAEDTAVKALYGSLARQSDDPVETFFDEVDDAEVAAQERLDLLGAHRRRFEVALTGTDELLALDYTRLVPVARYVDPERDCDRSVLVGEFAIDLGRDAARATVWG